MVVLPPAAFTAASKSDEAFCSNVSWKLEPPPSSLPLSLASCAFAPDAADVEGVLARAAVVLLDFFDELPQPARKSDSTATMATSQESRLLRFFNEALLGRRTEWIG